MRPDLQAASYGAALLEGAREMAAEIAQGKGVSFDEGTGLPPRSVQREPDARTTHISIQGIIFGIIILIFILNLFRRGGGGGYRGGGGGGFWTGFLLSSLLNSGGGGRGGGGWGWWRIWRRFRRRGVALVDSAAAIRVVVAPAAIGRRLWKSNLKLWLKS